MAQKDDFDSGIELYDTSEELVPLRKTSLTIVRVRYPSGVSMNQGSTPCVHCRTHWLIQIMSWP